MSYTITIAPGEAADHYTVEVHDDNSYTEYQVTVDPDWYADVASDYPDVEEVIRRSFLFLLEREPKESILVQFSLDHITEYFPEYPEALQKWVANA